MEAYLLIIMFVNLSCIYPTILLHLRKIKQIERILILALTSLSSFVFGQERKHIPESEIKGIIKLAIKLPELQQHFHIDEKHNTNKGYFKKSISY